MRTREEVMKEALGDTNADWLKLVLEVLLDIRDALQVTEPEEGSIRCVTCETHFNSEAGHFCSPLGRWIFGSTPMGSPTRLDGSSPYNAGKKRPL